MNFYKKVAILFIFLTIVLFKSYATGPAEDSLGGYEIKFQLKPFKNCTVMLAHYYGQQLHLDATSKLDENSEVVFKGDSKLKEGIYLVYEETNRGVIDFLMDDHQHFSVVATFSETHQSINFLNSKENVLLNGYKQFMAFREMEIFNYSNLLRASDNKKDSSFFISKLISISDSIQQFRENIIANNPGTFLTTLLIALREPVIPKQFRRAENAADSAAIRYYTKNKFWEGVNFWDSRLLYTPFFDSKVEKYFFEIIDNNADSVIKQIDWIMSTAVASESMSQMILEKLFYGTMYHRYKWDDAVFIHLFEKYISSKTYTWLLPEKRKLLTDHAYLLMANTKGTKAWEIQLAGLSGKKESLLRLGSNYTLLCFWDVTCDHCRETLPILDSIYRNSWKEKGLQIYAVSLESRGTPEDWKNFITQNQLESWTHVYNSLAEEKERVEKGESTVLHPYNIWYFPAFYLLDSDKHFMAKKLSYPQIVELTNSILKIKK